MDYNLITKIESCYSMMQDVNTLRFVIYAHIPAMLVALFIGIYAYVKNRQDLVTKILLAIAVSFSIWTLADLIIWIYNFDSEKTLFAWAILGIFEALFFALSFYLTYLFIHKKDIRLAWKIIMGITLLPLIILLPTKLNLSGFDTTECVPNEGAFYKNYIYALEIIYSLLLVLFSIIGYKKSDKEKRKQILLLSMGLIIFLFLFFSSGYIADKLYSAGYVWAYILEQVGLFGMLIFIGFLAYLIVKFRAFNIKLIGAQALVAALWIGIGSQFFFIQNPTNRILNAVTFCLALGFGYFLVKSVKLEVRRKEELQSLSDQLGVANDKLRQLDKAKSEFISIASHQLRTPLTSIKGFSSLLLEGTYGAVPESQRSALEKIYISNERLIQLVEDLLNISRIEAGRMEFDFQEAAIEDLVDEAVKTLELSAKAKSLYLHWEKPAQAPPRLKIDITKIKEVISNMVDNSIKYTQKGGVTVKVDPGDKWVRVVVSDTGIGMDKEEIDMIFEKFQRGKQVSHYHTDGTGLGMYIGKKIVAEHKGHIWAESDGKGKGSKFILELPINGKNTEISH